MLWISVLILLCSFMTAFEYEDSFSKLKITPDYSYDKPDGDGLYEHNYLYELKNKHTQAHDVNVYWCFENSTIINDGHLYLYKKYDGQNYTWVDVTNGYNYHYITQEPYGNKYCYGWNTNFDAGETKIAQMYLNTYVADGKWDFVYFVCDGASECNPYTQSTLYYYDHDPFFKHDNTSLGSVSLAVNNVGNVSVNGGIIGDRLYINTTNITLINQKWVNVSWYRDGSLFMMNYSTDTSKIFSYLTVAGTDTLKDFIANVSYQEYVASPVFLDQPNRANSGTLGKATVGRFWAELGESGATQIDIYEKQIRFIDEGTTNPLAWNTFSPLSTGTTTITYQMMSNDTTYNNFVSFQLNSTEAYLFRHYTTTNQHKLVDDRGTTIIDTATDNTYYSLMAKIYHGTGKYDFFINGVLKSTNATLSNSIALNRIELSGSSTSKAYRRYVSNITIRDNNNITIVNNTFQTQTVSISGSGNPAPDLEDVFCNSNTSFEKGNESGFCSWDSDLIVAQVNATGTGAMGKYTYPSSTSGNHSWIGLNPSTQYFVNFSACTTTGTPTNCSYYYNFNFTTKATTSVYISSLIYSNYITYKGINYTKQINYVINATCSRGSNTNISLYVDTVETKTHNLNCYVPSNKITDNYIADTENIHNLSFYLTTSDSPETYNGWYGNQSFLYDLYAPTTSIWFTSEGSVNTTVSMICYDTIAPMLNYTSVFNSATLRNSNFTSGTLIYNYSTLIGGENIASATCKDYLYSTSNSSVQTVFIKNINIFDENTNERIYKNVTVQFDANDTIIEFVTNTSMLNVTLGNFNYTVRFSATGYYPSLYYWDESDGNTTLFNAYMTNSSDTVTFTFKPYNSGVLLEGVTMKMYRVINTTLQLVGERLSDVTGRTQFHYTPEIKYTFVANLDGYIEKTFDLDPILFSSYDILLQPVPSTSKMPDYSGIQVVYVPSTFYANELNYFNFSIFSPDGTLSSFGFNITYFGGSYKNTGTSPYGKTTYYGFSIGDASINSKLNLTYWYTSSYTGYKIYQDDFFIINPANYTAAINKANNYGMGLFERVVWATFLLIVFAGIAYLIGGGTVALGLGLLLGVLFIYMGLLPPATFYISGLLMAMILIWRTDI